MSSQLPSNIQPGSVVENRNRLWRVDSVDGNVVTATPLDGNTADRHRFYTPVENIREGSLEPPDPDHQAYHGEHGQVVAVLSDDADSFTADERDAQLYQVVFDSGETADFRWRDLRPPIDGA